MKKERIVALIVTYNRKETVTKCLNSLEKLTESLDEILVVDNASSDGTFEFLKNKFKNVAVIKMNENIGPAGGVAVGQKIFLERGFDWLWLLDDDAEVEENSLKELIKQKNEFFKEKKENFYLLSISYGDKELTKPLFNIFNYNEKTGLTVQIKENNYKKDYFSFILGPMLGLFIPYNLLQSSGIFKEEFFGWYDDSEFSLRAYKNGFKGFAVTTSKIYHPLIDTRKYIKVFKKNFTIYKGRPLRLYYGTRNTILTQRQWLSKLSFFFIFLPIFVMKRFLSIIIFYDKKYLVLKWFLKGVIDGLRNKSGKIETGGLEI